MDEIRIEDLEVFAHHGVFRKENQKGQPFFVRAVLYTDTQPAGTTDRLSLSTNYGEVCHFITDWMQGHTYRLIESVAEQVAEEVLLAFPHVKALDLEIRKPEAPIDLPFQCVSVKIHRGWHTAYIAVGSNLGDREQYIADGIAALAGYRQIQVVKQSSILTTKPYGGVEQGDFLNGAVKIKTLFSPKQLLAVLHEIEAAAKRERKVHWGPRTLDLDIIFYDKLVYEDEELIIPHVDMQNRDFVLKPMVEIAPNYRHPLLGKTMQELSRELEP